MGRRWGRLLVGQPGTAPCDLAGRPSRACATPSVIPDTHRLLMNAGSGAEQVEAFLRTGRFRREARPEGVEEGVEEDVEEDVGRRAGERGVVRVTASRASRPGEAPAWGVVGTIGGRRKNPDGKSFADRLLCASRAKQALPDLPTEISPASVRVLPSPTESQSSRRVQIGSEFVSKVRSPFHGARGSSRDGGRESTGPCLPFVVRLEDVGERQAVGGRLLACSSARGSSMARRRPSPFTRARSMRS